MTLRMRMEVEEKIKAYLYLRLTVVDVPIFIIHLSKYHPKTPNLCARLGGSRLHGITRPATIQELEQFVSLPNHSRTTGLLDQRRITARGAVGITPPSLPLGIKAMNIIVQLDLGPEKDACSQGS